MRKTESGPVPGGSSVLEVETDETKRPATAKKGGRKGAKGERPETADKETTEE